MALSSKFKYKKLGEYCLMSQLSFLHSMFKTFRQIDFLQKLTNVNFTILLC